MQSRRFPFLLRSNGRASRPRSDKTVMKDKITITTILFLIFGAIVPIVQPAASQIQTVKEQKSSPPKFALLIGINNYISKEIRDLSGAENDVKLMRELLTEVYGFNTQTDIKELLSSSSKPSDKPTGKTILDNFDRHLIENAGNYYTKNKIASPDKGATVVFFYSGHGSHLADDNGDEADGEDETIVPMDGDLIGTKDIRDDEFDRRFSELKKYTTNITFIFDSCHSGTITRGFGSRGLERPKANKNAADATLSETIVASGGDYVAISGSLPNEKALENFLPDQNDMRRNAASPKMEMNGYLTYFLTQTLRETPGASYRDVMKTVKAAVQKRNPEQHPQIEGDVDRAVFGAAVSGKRKTIDILNAKKSGEATVLTIAAGKIVGAFPGGAVSIYQKPGDADPFAVGEIVEPVDYFTANVRVSQTNIPPGAGIVLAMPFFGSDKRVAALDLTANKNAAENTDAGLQMIKRLAQKLENNDYVTAKLALDPLRKNQKDWNIAVVRSAYGEFKKLNPQPLDEKTIAPEDDEDIYYLSSVNGNPLFNFRVRADDANAEEKIQTALEKYVRADNLRALGNEASAIKNGLDLKIIRLKALKTPLENLEDVAENGVLQSPVLSVGDLFSFEVVNKTDHSLFVYIYSIGTDGAIKLLYEPKADGDALPGGQTRKFLNAPLVARATAPYGIETFKLIAATRRFNGGLLEETAITRQISESLNPLESLLARAAANTRDSARVKFDFNEWTTTSLDIEIKAKQRD